MLFGFNNIDSQKNHHHTEGYSGFSKRQWKLLIEIINVFDSNNSLHKQNTVNIEYVWQKIIMIREKLYDNIDNILRGLFELYSFIGEKEQLTELNKTLFRLNHLCEQKFYYYNNARIGLAKYLKLLKTTYGSDHFVLTELRLVNNLYSFINQYHHRFLINEYKYLKNISLPVKDYEEIRLNLITLLKKFNHIYPIITNPGFFDELKADIHQYKKMYIKEYLHEHEIYHEKLKNFYNRLHNLPEYKTIAVLSQIKTDQKVQPIKKYVENFFPDQCKIDLEDIEKLLHKQPKCNCGFTMGSSLSIPSLNKITPMLKKGINDYRKQLQNRKYICKKTNSPFT